MIHPIFDKIFSPFMAAAQKTAEQIREIPKDNKIQITHWSDTDSLGWFTTELSYTWWEPNIPAFVKEWTPWDFEDWIAATYYYMDRGPDFWEWWHDRPAKMQDILVGEFIAAHEPMIRKELDEYYAKHQNTKTC
jgi:hypothetical protein